MRRGSAVVAVVLAWMVVGCWQAAAAAGRPAGAVVLPGPADGQSLGFGSGADDVQRLLGAPTRRARVKGRELWFYGLSRVELENGAVVGWTRFDQPLPMNIGAAKQDAMPVAVGDTPQQLVDARGTPKAVVSYPEGMIWFYEEGGCTLTGGRVTALGYRSAAFEPGVANPRPASATGDRDVPSVVFAPLMLKEYLRNAVAADAKYKRQTITVSGQVQRVSRDAEGTPFVELGSEQELVLEAVLCAFPPDKEGQLVDLRPGRRVTITGRCQGQSLRSSGLRDVVLTGCELTYGS